MCEKWNRIFDVHRSFSVRKNLGAACEHVFDKLNYNIANTVYPMAQSTKECFNPPVSEPSAI